MSSTATSAELEVGPFRAAIDFVSARAYRIPTESPESDGTANWNATTLTVVFVGCADRRGFGYTYGHASVAEVVKAPLKGVVLGSAPFDIPSIHERMVRQVRNAGAEGIAACAISAVDIALWDLKARLLGVPLTDLLGTRRATVPAYASGGFTSYSPERLDEQVVRWLNEGFEHMKIKIGQGLERDRARVARVQSCLEGRARLMVDANGAYTVGDAVQLKNELSRLNVEWLEEPVSSKDHRGLREVRRFPSSPVQIAAGEYGYGPDHQRRLLQAGSVDVVQIDATRCLGITGALTASALADAFEVPVSTHTAPSVHAHLGLTLPRLKHAEYFYDHVRIEQRLFDGFSPARGGQLRANRNEVGHGLSFREADAERFAA